VTWRARSSGGVAASCRHSAAILLPTRGKLATHSGGAGTPRAALALEHATASSARSTIAMTAMVSGAARIVSITRVMTVTARTRLPHSRACIARNAGQVATTTIVAQTTAGRNGRRTQK